MGFIMTFTMATFTIESLIAMTCLSAAFTSVSPLTSIETDGRDSKGHHMDIRRHDFSSDRSNTVRRIARQITDHCIKPWPKGKDICGRRDQDVIRAIPAPCPVVGPPRLFTSNVPGPRRIGNRLQMDIQWAPPLENVEFVSGYRVQIIEVREPISILNDFEVSKEDVCVSGSNICQLSISSSSVPCREKTLNFVVAHELFRPRYLEHRRNVNLTISALSTRNGSDQGTVSASVDMPTCRELNCPNFTPDKETTCTFILQSGGNIHQKRICYCEPLVIEAGSLTYNVTVNNTVVMAWPKPSDYFIDGVVKTEFYICVRLFLRNITDTPFCSFTRKIEAADFNNVTFENVFNNKFVVHALFMIKHVRSWCSSGDDLPCPRHRVESDYYSEIVYPVRQVDMTAGNSTSQEDGDGDLLATDVKFPSDNTQNAVPSQHHQLIAIVVSGCVLVLIITISIVAVMTYLRHVNYSKRTPLYDIKQCMLSNTIIRKRLERLVNPEYLLDFLISEGCVSVDSPHYNAIRQGLTPADRARNMIKVMQVCDEKTFQTIRRYLHYGPLTEDFEPPLRPDDSPPASLTSEVYLGCHGINQVRRVYISYSRYPENLKETVLHFATVLANSGVQVILDQFYQVEAADCLSEWVDQQFEAAHFIVVVLSPKYPLNLSAEEKRILAGTEDFMVSLYEAKLLQSCAIAGRENFIIPVYFGYGACPPSNIPLLLKNKSVYTVTPQCDQSDKGIQQMIHRFYQVNMITSSL